MRETVQMIRLLHSFYSMILDWLWGVCFKFPLAKGH